MAYGAVLAASNPDVASGLIETPLDTIALLIPTWYPVPLIAALALSLLSGVVISLYSGGFALQATGATMRRSASVVVVGVALAGVAILIALSVGDFTLLLRDVATSLAVPVAAWAGIFAAEMMIRNRRFDTESLVTRGGVYPDVNWTNLVALVLASAIGFGLTTATVGWLSWQGYLFPLLDVAGTSDLAASDLGVLVALVLGLLVPIIGGIPRIRRQEEPAAVRARTPQD
jgi:purine-cytosine permease-like protein